MAPILAGIILFFFIFPNSAQADESCMTLLQNKCLSCHFETRICRKLEKKKGKSSWKRTIKSMIRHGTELSKGEQKALLQCFTARDSSVLSFCELEK